MVGIASCISFSSISPCNFVHRSGPMSPTICTWNSSAVYIIPGAMEQISAFSCLKLSGLYVAGKLTSDILCNIWLAQDHTSSCVA